MNDDRVDELIKTIKPKAGLTREVKIRIKEMRHNCEAAQAFAGKYLEHLDTLPGDVQLGLLDVLKESVELKLKCVKLLSLDRLENLPVVKIDEEWERLCTSLSFVCLNLNPEARDRLDAIL